MNQLSNANNELDKMTDNDVRIIYLPPMIVAAAYVTGEDCEGKSIKMIEKFVQNSNLLKIKPDVRSFGFDRSKGTVEIGENSNAYETWVSVPDNMEIPAPLVRREFKGGIYAAHVLRSWDFNDWRLLGAWVNDNDKYGSDWGSPRWLSDDSALGEGFEETLNFYHFAKNGFQMKDLQLDLLFPIKEK